MIKEFIDKNWDEFLGAYYNQECKGCPEGHSSFWKTLIESDEWKKWKEFNNNTNWDFSENEELGILSAKHFKSFLNFVKYEQST
ncbi:MAG: hypothetical protein AABY10_03710 [Nanoarchaeota archaeon]